MDFSTLGRTELKVSKLGLGGLFTSQLGGSYGQSEATIRKAVSLGINYIDTAPAYSDSEAVVGRSLREVGDQPIVSTKLGGGSPDFDPQNADILRGSIERSLKRLDRTSIELLFIHEPDRPGQYDWWAGSTLGDSVVLRLIEDLKREGLVRHVGIGGTTAYELARLVDTCLFDVVLTAANYSLLWREAEIEILPIAKKNNVGVVAGTPLQQGAFARRYDAEILDNRSSWLSKPRREQFRALYRFLDTIDIPIAELALRFMLSRPEINCVLAGARSSQEVEANVQAIEKGPLPTEIVEAIDVIAAMVPFRPFEEPFALPFGRPREGPGMLR